MTIELVEFKCDSCSIKWKALPSCTQTRCFHCGPPSEKKWISHDRTISPHRKKPPFVKRRIEAKPAPNIPIVQERSELIPRHTRSWNQTNLAKKYLRNPDVAKCGCGNYFMKRINKFGSNKTILVTTCPQCGESSDLQTQLNAI